MKKVIPLLLALLFVFPVQAQAKINYYTIDKGDTRPRSVKMVWREAYKSGNQVIENVFKFVNVPEAKAQNLLETYGSLNPYRAELIYSSTGVYSNPKYALLDKCNNNEVRLGMYQDCQLGVILKKDVEMPVIKDTCTLDGPLKKINNQYYAPLRTVVNVLGGYIVWNGQTKTINIIKNLDDPEKIGKMKYDYSLKLNQSYATAKGKKINLGGKPIKINNITYLPVNSIAKLMGCQLIDWQKAYPDIPRIDLIKKGVVQ